MATEQRHLTASLQDATLTGLKVIGFRVSTYAIGFVASVLISRALGPTGRGLYTLPAVIVSLVVTTSHLGLEQSNVYLASRGVPLRRLWANGSVVAVVMGVVSWVVIAGLFLGDPSLLGDLPVSWIAIALGLTPVLLHILYWTNVLQLDHRLLKASRAGLLGVTLHAAAVIGLYVTGALTPFRVLALMWLANGVTWLAIRSAGRRAGLVGAHAEWATIRSGVNFGLKLYGGLLFGFLLLRVDQLLVQQMLGYRALGLYSLAATLAELMWLVSDPLASALLPHQVRAAPGDERRLGYAAARLNLMLAAVAGVAAWIAAPWAIRLLYGPEFVGAVWPFRLLIPGVVVLAAQRPLSAIVLKDGRAGLVSALGGSALAVNVAGNILLIPRIGLTGASVASTICYIGLTVAYVLATRERSVVGWRDLVPRGADVRMLRDRFARKRRGSPAEGSLRVVLLLPNLDRGGTEGQAVKIARGLVARNHAVTVLCLSHEGAMADEVRALGCTVQAFGFEGFSPVLNPFPVGRKLAGITRAIRDARPDVVQCYLTWGNVIGVPLARVARVPVVLGSRRSLSEARTQLPVLRPLELLADRIANAVVCNGSAVLEDAIAKTRLPRRKGRVILNGVDIPDTPTPIPERTVLLCVANLLPYKRHHLLLRAFAAARAQLAPEAVQLRLAGAGPEERRLRALAADLGVRSEVHFLGSVADVGAEIDRCSFTILTSISEGMPNAILESLARGRPVIAGDSGGMREILSSGGGILVPDTEPESFADAIASLARDPERVRRLGAEGRELVRERFATERTVEQTIGLYRELLGRHVSTRA